MTAYASPIEVIQAAVQRFGDPAIASLDSDVPTAQIMRSNYEGIVRASLTRHAWSFATDSIPLAYQGPVLISGFYHAYVWPQADEVVNIRWLEREGIPVAGREYRKYRDRILTRSTGTYAVIATLRVPESQWESDFAEAIVTKMHALLLNGLADRWQDARIMERDGEQKLQQAVVRDRRQSPGNFLERYNPLVAAHRTSGYRRG